MEKIKLSLVVPCYNEEQNVKNFYDAAQMAFVGNFDNYEMIFINDGSRDNTWAELKKLHALDKRVKILNFSRNFGKEAAMYAGLGKAKGEFVTIIDADLQQRPELVVEMVDFLEKNEEYDSVAMFQKDRNEGKLLGFFGLILFPVGLSIVLSVVKEKDMLIGEKNNVPTVNDKNL